MGRGGALLAARAGNRMRTRQAYRTVDRMQRRRGRGPAGEAEQQAPAAAAAPAYTVELERLADLHAKGVLSDGEYEAKKQQVLGL